MMKFIEKDYALLLICRVSAMFMIFSAPFCQNMYGQENETDRLWNQPIKPFRIIGNIYYVGAYDVTSFLITTPAGHILLDSGFAETVPQIKENIATLGFRLEDVKILINSHAHYDHAGGLAELKRLTGAKLLVSSADARLLADGGRSDFHFQDKIFHFAPVETDQIIRDRSTIKLGGVKIKVHLTPGHTKGCTTWTMKVKENGRNFNVVFVCSTSVPGYQLVDNDKYPEIASDYNKSFRKMKRLSADVFLASHGSFFGLQEKIELLAKNPDQNPFVDPQGYKDFLLRAEKRFQTLLEEQKSKKSINKIQNNFGGIKRWRK